MRLGLLVIALAACSGPGAASASPAWPKPRVREVDGGESLAPRAAARAIVARLEDDKSAEREAPDKPAAATPAATPPDEPVTDEDMVIEIED
jgi:hypothetical protein